MNALSISAYFKPNDLKTETMSPSLPKALPPTQHKVPSLFCWFCFALCIFFVCFFPTISHQLVTIIMQPCTTRGEHIYAFVDVKCWDHPTAATGTQLLLHQLQFGLAAMATFAAPLFGSAARRRRRGRRRRKRWWRRVVALWQLARSRSLLGWGVALWPWGWRHKQEQAGRSKRG